MTENHEEPRAAETYACPACKQSVNPASPFFAGVCQYCGDDLALSATNLSQNMQMRSEEMNRLAWTWYRRADSARRAAADHAERLAAEQSVAVQSVADQIDVEAARASETVAPVGPGSSVTVEPGPARPPKDQSTQALPSHKRTPRKRPNFGWHVEPAVMLQGLGALLLLAALTIITTVSWAFLPSAGQAAVLAVPLLVMGGSAIVLRDRLPTTSTVLALLTIGAGLVQAVALPELLPAFDFVWYPSVAAAVGVVIFGLVGRWGRVLVWRVFAVAAVPLIPLLAAWTLVTESELVPSSSAVVLTTVTAPFVGALLVVASRVQSRDSTTAAVSWWTSAIMVPILGVAMLAEMGRLAYAGPDGLLQAVSWAFGVLLVAVLSYGVGRLATGTNEAWKWLAAGLAAMPLPAILGWAIGAQTLWVLVQVLFFTGALLAIVVVDVASRMQSAVLAGLLVAQSAVIVTSLSNPGQPWAWVLMSGSALGASAVLIGFGVKRQTAVACWTGLFGLLGTWAALWFGNFVGPSLEALIWPMFAMTIATAFLARRQFKSMESWWPGPGLPLLAVAAGTPVVLASWQQHYVDGAVSGLTTFSLLVLVTLIILSTLAGWMPAPLTSAAAVISVVLLPHAWITLSARGDIDAVLLVSLLTAVGVGFIGAFAVHEGLVEPAGVYVAITFTLLIGSTTLTILDPVDTWQADRWRLWFVGLGLVAAIAGAVRPWPNAARYLGAATLALGLWWYVAISTWAWSGVEGGLPPEAWTGPALGVLIAIIYVVPTVPDRLLAVAVVAGVVLLVSTALALQTLRSVASPFEIGGFADAARVVVVPLLWVGWTVAARWRGSRVWRVLGVVSVLTLWAYWVVIGAQRDVQAAAEGLAGLPIEYYTIATGILVAACTWIWVAGRHVKLPTMFTMAPSAALLLLPSSSVMWLGEPVIWRFWLTLGLAIVGLAVGLRFRLAGLVWPSALALVVLAAPVVVRWTQSAPVWVPLSLGGLALLAVGARFEATRRAGRQAGEWVSTLH